MLQIESIHYSSHSFTLQNISFQLQQGEILGVIGESGCGKTTLLNLIYGRLDLNSGSIIWKNNNIYGPSRELIPGNEEFKYLTQDADLMPYTSALDNIIKPLSRQYLDKNISIAKELLKMLGLEAYEKTKVIHLSGGQRQRVALAQALAKTPKLLLLDEPLSHIDAYLKNQIRRNLFQYIKKHNISCILATHDKDDILPYADRIVVLKDGKQIELNSSQMVYKNPQSSYTAGLFGEFNQINAQSIFLDLTKTKQVVVYPSEIRIEESSTPKVKIINQYFYGHYYKVYLLWNGQEIVCNSPIKISKSIHYTIKFDKEVILRRYDLQN